MPASIRCRITGCDLDECGVCRRCGDASKAEHRWQEATRNEPCFPRWVCERCGKERQQPDHDWETVGDNLKCRRCRLTI